MESAAGRLDFHMVIQADLTTPGIAKMGPDSSIAEADRSTWVLR